MPTAQTSILGPVPGPIAHSNLLAAYALPLFWLVCLLLLSIFLGGFLIPLSATRASHKMFWLVTLVLLLLLFVFAPSPVIRQHLVAIVLLCIVLVGLASLCRWLLFH